MKLFEELYPLLMPELPGCSYPMLDLNLREVAREFCTTTSVWRSTFDGINLLANQLSYDLDTPESESELVRLTKLSIADDLMWVDDEYIAPTNRRRTDALVPRPKYNRDEPPFTLTPDLVQLTLIANLTPSASLAGGLKLEGVMRPARDATQLPDLLVTQYSEAMRLGTLARLMLMGNKTWSNPALAMEYRTAWNQQKAFAAYQGQVGNTRQHLRTKKWG